VERAPNLVSAGTNTPGKGDSFVSRSSYLGIVEGILEVARTEGRELTDREREEIETLGELARSPLDGKGLPSELGGGGGEPVTKGGLMQPLSGPGDAFVASEGWKKVSDPMHRGQRWSTGPVEIRFKAGTVLESGQGAGWVATPQVLPGAVDKLFEPLGVADVFGTGQAATSSVRYVIEGTATSGATGVAEGALKPASDLAYSTVDEKVQKIATVLTISDEIAEDTPSIQTYLNSRLSLFVRMEEERQLLRGAGSGSNELLGIFGRSGINQYTKAAADSNVEAIARVLANTAGSAYLQPDTIIMHPSNWLSSRLLRAGTAGEFFGGGPWGAAYNGSSPGVLGASMWNTRVVLSSVVGPGTALVGNFGQGAQIWRRGALTVEATNAHLDYFQRNLLMLRAESRAALACYRPVAFTEVRGLA
jgi:HK97 family phage major capsid protein